MMVIFLMIRSVRGNVMPGKGIEKEIGQTDMQLQDQVGEPRATGELRYVHSHINNFR